MTVLPVIERELRAAARLRFTYLLRVLGVVALLAALALPEAQGNLGVGGGGRLFGYFHCVLFAAIWFLVPLLAADALSRERREGTLPLLFLTLLKPPGIVYAKGMVHGLRAFTLWLAVLPVVTVCFVAGGVGWSEVILSELVNFSSLCLALAAGLAASALTRVGARAIALAVVLAFVFLLTFCSWLPSVLVGSLWVGGFPVPSWANWWGSSGSVGFALAVNRDNIWQDLQGNLRIGPVPLVASFLVVALLCLFGALMVVQFAAWAVGRNWREDPSSARVVWLRSKLLKPVFFQQTLRRWLRWQLRRNPIGWLEQRSWSGRLVVWSWFAIVACAYSSLFANLSLYKDGFERVQGFLASVLLISVAVSAAGSFRRERETGVLELLLVAPLRESQIISGRVRGLWTQFIPASVLLCGVWLYCGTFLAIDSQFRPVLLYIVAFVTLPVVGLYFSLTRSSFMAALLWTLLAQFALPAVLMRLGPMLVDALTMPGDSNEPFVPFTVVLVLFQVMVALFLGWRLHENLKRRQFAFDRCKA